ncbi:MAG: hypothetical protein P1U88_08450 [Thalassobaculaceae bacterium]|nr:hypothetical protein [Thalassobaculaceae bacterium]
MDAARLRSILSAAQQTLGDQAVPIHSVAGGGLRQESRTAISAPLGAADFIGLALTAVAGRTVPAAGGRETSADLMPATPALDCLTACYVALGSGWISAAPPHRYAPGAVRQEMERLCRVAALPRVGARAVVSTAPEIAAILTELSDAADAGGIGPGRFARMRPTGSSARTGLTLGAAAPEVGMSGTTVGPRGDNHPDAVVLTRLFLKRLPAGPSPVARSGQPLPHDAFSERSGAVADLGRLTAPAFPAVDDALFRAIGRWRSEQLPPALRRAADVELRMPVARWSPELIVLATLTVGAPDWTSLRIQAGCAGLRLWVMAGTAIVLVDRKLGAVRDAVRDASWTLARRHAMGLAPSACDALMSAAIGFYVATGQILVPRCLEGCVLQMALDIDWFEPHGGRRHDPEAVEMIADTAPLAAKRLLDLARAALAADAPPWKLIGGRRTGRCRRLAVRLDEAMLVPGGG